MSELPQRIAVWIVSMVAAYLVYRWIFAPKEAGLTDYERSIEEIMTSDKYKVKGRFEE